MGLFAQTGAKVLRYGKHRQILDNAVGCTSSTGSLSVCLYQDRNKGAITVQGMILVQKGIHLRETLIGTLPPLQTYQPYTQNHRPRWNIRCTFLQEGNGGAPRSRITTLHFHDTTNSTVLSRLVMKHAKLYMLPAIEPNLRQSLPLFQVADRWQAPLALSAISSGLCQLLPDIFPTTAVYALSTVLLSSPAFD